MSKNAHLISFGEKREPSIERIDFALLAVSEHKALGYITCREADAETVYWQFGGPFPGTKGSSVSFRCYQAAVEWCKLRYDRVYTFIENSNKAMLKMALEVGFLIVGVRVFKGQILVELLLEFP